MKPEPARLLNPEQHLYLLASLFITGAATLVLEIAGTRVLSPYYGSSLYCWSALITVTLVALAGGYKFGGSKADELASLTLFARILCLAALCVAVVPVLRAPVLKLTSPLGIKLGALASAAVLIAPALFLLSALGPLSIRLTASSLAVVASAAGDVYAVSTLGSVLGAALAGFVLIPHLSISAIFYGLAVLLLLLGALGSYLSAPRLPFKQLAAAGAAAAVALWPRQADRTSVVINRESQYAQIKVVDMGRTRFLMVNGTSQSVASLDGFESTSPYIHVLELTALLRPRARRALVIGVGGGLLPSSLEKNYGLIADTIDVDPAMIETARRYFNFAPHGDVAAGDGRVDLEQRQGRYDILALDAFGGEQPPYHLFTAEAFQAMRRALKPGGILAINLVSLITEPGDEPWLSAYATLRLVFPEVRVLTAQEPYRGMANLVFFCSDKAWLAAPGPAGRARPLIRKDVAYALAHEVTPDAAGLQRATLMTDDHAPMDFLMARTSLLWRKSLQENLEDVLLY